MFKSQYVARVYQTTKEKNACEKEFLQAVFELFSAIDDYIDQNQHIEQYAILERMVEPERMISFRVPWIDDNNQIQVNRGYRVQFNSAIGPYKGGLRFHRSVNQSIIKFLGFEQAIKNSLTGLPLGGGKGGADFSPKKKSDAEIMRFCQSYMAELYRHIGPNTDVPAGDIGVGAREIGYLFGYYKKLQNQFTGTITGKGLSYGGSLVRTEATGYGLCYFVLEMLRHFRKTDFIDKNVVISGSGNVALYAAKKAVELGAKVIAMSDSSGYICDENGLDIDAIIKIKDKRESILLYKEHNPHIIIDENSKNIWRVACDIAMPCATENELDLDDAKCLVKNGVYVVAEGANMPATIEATDYFLKKGVLFAPGKAANAGGVATSGLEMSQNAMGLSWTFAEVDEKLQNIMKKIFHEVIDAAQEMNQKDNLVVGANVAGFRKLCDAMIAQGVI